MRKQLIKKFIVFGLGMMMVLKMGSGVEDLIGFPVKREEGKENGGKREEKVIIESKYVEDPYIGELARYDGFEYEFGEGGGLKRVGVMERGEEEKEVEKKEGGEKTGVEELSKVIAKINDKKSSDMVVEEVIISSPRNVKVAFSMYIYGIGLKRMIDVLGEINGLEVEGNDLPNDPLKIVYHGASYEFFLQKILSPLGYNFRVKNKVLRIFKSESKILESKKEQVEVPVKEEKKSIESKPQDKNVK